MLCIVTYAGNFSSTHIESMRAHSALDELQVLVHHDQGPFMHDFLETSPGDLSTDDRGPPGCHVLIPTVTQTISAQKNTKCHKTIDELNIPTQSLIS